jgi:predicted lipoprotein with Yx(FWY)xxD motif
MSDMQQKSQSEDTARRVPLGRWTAVAAGFVGLFLSVVFTGTAGAAKAVVVSTDKTASMGTVLVSGKTLYTLMPSQTKCTTQCLKIWPPFVLPAHVTKAQAGTGVNAAKLGTVKRNGVLQVTYSGKPLYFYVGDAGVGQVNGNFTDKWGKWSDIATVKPSGAVSQPSSAGSGGAAF